ncbi:MAG: hypothetical protein IPN13_07000 [Bacteroidetes bacterium]|nr:hypothetical protein [Bacteroidota bacterium]
MQVKKAYDNALAKAEDLKIKYADATFTIMQKLDQLQLPLALEKYRKAVELQPQDWLYLTDLGNFPLTMALYDESIKYSSLAITYLPNHPQNDNQKGTILNNLSLTIARGNLTKPLTITTRHLPLIKISWRGASQIATRYNQPRGEAP